MPIVDTRMLAHLHNFYPSTVTIQEAIERRGTAGEIIVDWEDKAAHVDLPARIAPSGGVRTGQPGGREVKLADQTYAISTHTIGLRANYPTITVEDRVVADDGLIFDILSIASDDQDASTYLYTEIVE